METTKTRPTGNPHATDKGLPMGDTEQPQPISSEHLRLLNTQYFHTLREAMNAQITGGIGRAIKKADAKIAKLEARVVELENQVAAMGGCDE